MEFAARGVRNVKRDRVALDFGCPSSHVAEHVGGKCNVGGFSDTKRFAIVECFQLRQFVRVVLDQIAYFPNQSATLRSGKFRPGAFVERFSGCCNGQIDIGCFALSRLSNHLIAGRIEDVKGFSTFRVYPLTIDHEFTWCRKKRLDRRQDWRFGGD